MLTITPRVVACRAPPPRTRRPQRKRGARCGRPLLPPPTPPRPHPLAPEASAPSPAAAAGGGGAAGSAAAPGRCCAPPGRGPPGPCKFFSATAPATAAAAAPASPPPCVAPGSPGAGPAAAGARAGGGSCGSAGGAGAPPEADPTFSLAARGRGGVGSCPAALCACQAHRSGARSARPPLAGLVGPPALACVALQPRSRRPAAGRAMPATAGTAGPT